MMPACSHTGTPRHFHVSTTSGSASLMRARTRASVSPRQSASSLMRASISWEGESGFFRFLRAALACLHRLLSSSSLADRSHPLAGQTARLLYPVGRAAPRRARPPRGYRGSGRSCVFDSPGGTGRNNAPRKNATFTYLREAVEAEEPAVLLSGARCHRTVSSTSRPCARQGPCARSARRAGVRRRASSLGVAAM